MSTGHPEAPRLIADIGGTHARFALVPAGDDRPARVRSLPCAGYPDFAAAARAYLEMEGEPRPREGLCAIANPVTGDALAMTNHPWRFSIEAARRALGLARLRFVNDWAAQALAIPHLAAHEREAFGGGEPRPGYPVAVLGPGTGLGVSGLVPSPAGWHAIEGEGGHVTWSPVTDREMALAAEIRRRHGHCSAERVASGIGLMTVHQALAHLDGDAEAQPPEPREITRRAGEGCPRCRETVEHFTLALATTAANLAITLGALGGTYLGGGILPRLGALFDRAAFRARFEDKGRFRGYLAGVPTYLVHAEHPALLGLAKALGPGHE